MTNFSFQLLNYFTFNHIHAKNSNVEQENYIMIFLSQKFDKIYKIMIY